jgi:hypothetical protein
MVEPAPFVVSAVLDGMNRAQAARIAGMDRHGAATMESIGAEKCGGRVNASR